MTDPANDPSHSSFSYETSTLLFLFTSLTAGSSHVITATSRLETILKANKIPFRAIDCATDEKARRIWSRRAGKRKLPGLVREGFVLADFQEVEEWNEDGDLKERLAASVDDAPASSSSTASSVPQPPSTSQTDTTAPSATQTTLPIREAQNNENIRKPSIPHDIRQAILDSKNDNTLHSTSPSVGFPPLHKSPVPRTTKIAFEDTDYLTSGVRGGSALATPDEPITASAGPAKKSGLAAVTSDPAVLASAGVQEKDTERGRARGRDTGTEADGDSHLKGAAVKVKFEEDQLKGDPRDGRAAEDSVGD